MAVLETERNSIVKFAKDVSTDGYGPSEIPYWLVNVPSAEWPSECPTFLQNISQKDREIIGTPDSDYHRLSWPEVRKVVEENRLENFERMPSDLRRYLAYKDEIIRAHGTILNFVLRKRLHWTDLAPTSPIPFQSSSDLKVLRNDWPYGIDSRITHLVVWTKFDLAEDPATGDLAKEARVSIDHWVKENVSRHMPEGHVVWFKNWRSLKSVHAVEHFHIMLFNAPSEFILQLTGGDVPASQNV